MTKITSYLSKIINERNEEELVNGGKISWPNQFKGLLIDVALVRTGMTGKT